MTLKHLSLAFASVSLSSLSGHSALAQEQSTVTSIEEIYITARRRDESVQDVPISISVMEGQSMDRLKLEQPEDLQYQIPSFMVQGASRDSLQMGIRGQYVNDALGTTDAPVNVYFGDALVTRPMGTNQSMYDLGSVQVLKGVQGTLFGRNSTGGALIISPAAPIDKFEANVKATVGNYGHKELQGMVNVPIADTLALRVAGKVLTRDGFGENLDTGAELEDKDLQAYRVSLQWNPTDTIESLTIYDHYEHDQGASTALSINAFDASNQAIAGYNTLYAASQSPFLQSIFPTLAGAFPGDSASLLAEQKAQKNPHDARSEGGTHRPDEDFFGSLYSTAENWGIQNVTTVEVGEVTIKNVAAYRQMEFDSVTDLDGSAAGFILANQGGQYDFKSDELQFIGTAFNESLDWLVGLYYMNENGDDYGSSNQFNMLSVEGTRLGTFGAVFNGTNLNTAIATANAAAAAASKIDTTSGDVDNTSKAIYAAVSYNLSYHWILASGLRYTEDERGYTATSNQLFLNTGVNNCTFLSADNVTPLPIANCHQEATETFEKVTYDATLTYNIDADSMVYGAYRLGYRAGGFNGRARTFTALEPYNPEEVKEIEVGFKSDFEIMDTPVRVNGAAFRQKYREIQRQTAVNLGASTIATVIENAAQGTLDGGELELEIRPTEFASISMFYSFVEGSFDKYTDPGSGADLSDQWLVWAPRNTMGVTTTLISDLEDMGELVWTLNVYGQTKSHLDDRDVESDQSGYALYNAAVTWENVAGSNFQLRLWGRNLSDKEYKAGGVGIIDAAGTNSVFYGNPRTFGLDIAYNFE